MNGRSEKKFLTDYRVNYGPDGSIISVEIGCCGQRIGELRYKDGTRRSCPVCGCIHSVIIQHNHFHLRRVAPGDSEG